MSRVLLVGVPRSGSSWAGRVLSRLDGVSYVHEPDNETVDAFAFRAKRALPRHPVLRPGDQAAHYAQLWDGAFSGGRPSRHVVDRLGRRLYAGSRGAVDPLRLRPASALDTGRLAVGSALARPLGGPAGSHVVVKSVFACLALDWIVERWRPLVVVTKRDPLNVVSSWKELGWRTPLDNDPRFQERFPDARQLLDHLGVPADVPAAPAQDRPLERLAWHLALLLSVVEDALHRHPEWHVLRHEAICDDPETGFRQLADTLGIGWSDKAQRYLEESNRAGAGTFDTARVADEEATRWKRRLTPAEADGVRSVLSAFPLVRGESRA